MSSPQVTVQGWTTVGELPAECGILHLDRMLVQLDQGQVLLAGGADPFGNAVRTAALFDPATGTWTSIDPMTETRRLHTMTLLPNGKVLAAGGIFGPFRFPTPSTDKAELFDPETKTWTPTKPMSEPRLAHTATLLADGRVLVAGGGRIRDPRSGLTLASSEIYDPETETWSVTKGPMTDPRLDAQAVLLPNNKVLTVGGTIETGHGSFASLAFCELFDPGTETWTPTGSMAGPRGLHQATLLPSGDVLVTGGGGGDLTVVSGLVYDHHSLATAELYNPVAGTWRPAGAMPLGRARHQAVLLGNGKVLVVGGCDEASQLAGFSAATMYDPLTDVWSSASALAEGRLSHGAIALKDGRILTTGGLKGIQVGTWVTEVFTP
jgi:hypothetical protein